MPTKDPRQTPQPTSDTPKNTASTVQTEVVAVAQHLAAEVSQDAYQVGLQTAEYVNQRAMASFLKGFNEGAANASNPFSQLRQQLSASRPKPINLLALCGSTNTAQLAPSPPSE